MPKTREQGGYEKLSCNHVLKNVNLQNASKEDWDLGTTLVPRDRGLRSHTQECPFKTQLQQRGLRFAYPFPRIVTQETNSCNHLLKNVLPKFATKKDWELQKTHIFQEPGNRLVPRGWELQYILKNVIPKFATKDWELHAQIFKNPGERLLPRDCGLQTHTQEYQKRSCNKEDWELHTCVFKNPATRLSPNRLRVANTPTISTKKRTENCIPTYQVTWNKLQRGVEELRLAYTYSRMLKSKQLQQRGLTIAPVPTFSSRTREQDCHRRGWGLPTHTRSRM